MNTQPNWAGGSYAGEQGVDSTRARPTPAAAELLKDDLVPSASNDDVNDQTATSEGKAEQSSSPAESPAVETEDEQSTQAPPKPARKPKRKVEAQLSGTLDDVLRTVDPEETGPSSEGLTGFANKVSFGYLKLKPSKAELEDRQDLKDIRAEWSRLMTYTCASTKGNDGKSLTTAQVAATFGLHRGGGIMAADYNEGTGTMAVTAESGRYDLTITEALRDAHRFESGEAHRGEWAQYVRQQSTHFDLLAADEEPSRMLMIGDEQVKRIHEIARRYYSVIGCDTGNISRTSAWSAVMNVTDQLVVPVNLGLKSTVNAYRMLEQLEAQGHEDLVQNAIIVITGRLGTDDTKKAKERRDALAHRTRVVVEIPYDKELAADRPSLPKVSPIVRRAYRRLAAEIARGFSASDPNHRRRTFEHHQ